MGSAATGEPTEYLPVNGEIVRALIRARFTREMARRSAREVPVRVNGWRTLRGLIEFLSCSDVLIIIKYDYRRVIN